MRAIIVFLFSLIMGVAQAQVTPGTSPLSISKGGTGGATASAARTSLGLAIGTNVEAWDSDLDCLAALATTGVLQRTGAGACATLTNAQLTALINMATPSLSGALPAWPNDVTKFFRGDGTYATLNVAALSGLGTGVVTALGTNIGSAGAPVLFNGAGGTPTSLGLANATGLPAATGLTGQVPIANGGTGQSTAPLARSSSGLNVERFTGHGDSAYTILATDRTVGTNAAFTASRTWTLPAANAVNAGQDIVVADFQGTVTGANTLVVQRSGADTVNGGTAVTITAANGAYLFKSDGVSKWTAQALGAAAAGGVSSVTCGLGLAGGTITTSGTCSQNAPNFKVHLAANQSVTSGTNTRINFDAVDIDTNTWWDTTNKRYTPQQAGNYHFCFSTSASGTFAAGSTVLEHWISKNGTIGGTGVSQLDNFTFAVSTAGGSIPGGCTEASMNGTTDFVEVDVNLGGTSPVVQGLAAPNIRTTFSGHRISN
jgi:hypothetical protein